jgi:hypothetical protein
MTFFIRGSKFQVEVKYILGTYYPWPFFQKKITPFAQNHILRALHARALEGLLKFMPHTIELKAFLLVPR